MTKRFLRLLACQLLLVFACAQAYAAEAIDITHAHIEATEDGYSLAANFAFDLSQELQLAVEHTLQLTFKTEIELTRPRWYWKDERAVVTSQLITLSLDALTRQYVVRVNNGNRFTLQQSLPTLEDALVMIHRQRWQIARRGDLKPGETYDVTLRMYMDQGFFSKPLRVNALNNSDWRLASKDKKFTYKAE